MPLSLGTMAVTKYTMIFTMTMLPADIPKNKVQPCILFVICLIASRAER